MSLCPLLHRLLRHEDRVGPDRSFQPVLAQDKPADNMQIPRGKIKADKKLLVARNMESTE
jgi:hypothetical protein